MQFLEALDLARNELRNARVQNLASAPGTPVAGQIYFDTTANTFYYYDGTGWVGAGTVNYAGDATITTIQPDATASGGASSDAARGDHRHAIAAAAAGASAVGDTAAEGTATAFARSDHRHGREGFGAVQAETNFGGASANGVATSISRSDHQHGTPAHGATQHSGISLSALAAPTADLSIGNHKLTGLLDPTNAQDAATKAYVDATAQGMDVKESVRATSTGNVSLTAQASRTMDGVSLSAGDRVLLKDQTTASQNGIYVVQGDFSLNRAADFDSSDEVSAGAFTFVEEGTNQADSGWVLTTDDPITVGTTALSFAQFSGAGQIEAGSGLTKSGNTLDVGAGSGISVGADVVSVIFADAEPGQVSDTAGTVGVSTQAAREDHSHDLALGGTPASIEPDDTASSGASTAAARADHQHAIVAAAPATTLTLATTNAEGNATSFARSNHTHAVQQATAAPPAVDTASATGTSSNVARQDHTHAGITKVAVDCAAATTTTVTHNLNTRDVKVEVYRNSTPWDTVFCDVERDTLNSVVVRFATAPTAGQFRIVVEG